MAARGPFAGGCGMTESSTSSLACARSWLFVPATRPERFAKALASGADAVILDLEDAVASADKVSARQSLLPAVEALHPAQRSRLLVRINAAGTPWHAGDLAALHALVAKGLGAVMVPKAESVAGLAEVARAAGPCALLPLIESVAGLDAANLLAASPQVRLGILIFRLMPAWLAAQTSPSWCRCAWRWCWRPAAPCCPRP
jgi:citrate lyase subunit beta/citryl-CoA lyase